MSQFSPYPSQTFGSPAPTPAKTSGLAIASLILGILGFCTGGVTGLIGLIIGIAALSVINKSPGEVGGKGAATAGVAISASSIVIGCILVGMVGLMLPALAKARMMAKSARTQVYLSHLANAQMSYSSDHNDLMPPADSWIEALRPYVSGDIDSMISSPFSDADERLFAMNINLDGVRSDRISQPTSTPLFFEVAPGSPLAGGMELMSARPGNRHGYLIVFVDGHAEEVPSNRVRTLTWKP